MLQEAIFPLDYVYLSEVAYFLIFFFFDKRYRGSVLRIRIKHVDSKIFCQFFSIRILQNDMDSSGSLSTSLYFFIAQCYVIVET